jgi:hypothetical protein
MKVIAQRGLRVPRVEKPRTHITDQTSVDVPDTSYYRRRLRSGELVAVTDTAPAAETAAPETKPSRSRK